MFYIYIEGVLLAGKRRLGGEIKPHGGHKKLKIAGAIIVMLVAASAYLYAMYGSLPTALLTAKQINQSVIEGAILQKINATPMLDLTYSGSVVINNTDPLVSINFVKYHNDSRLTLNYTEFPVLGNLSVVTISLGNGTTMYNCLKAWNGSGGTGNQYACTRLGAAASSAYTGALDRLINVSGISGVDVHSYGISAFDGQPCYSVNATGAVPINNTLFGQPGWGDAQFVVNACISAQYDLPLTASAAFTDAAAHGRVYLNMSETGLYTVSSQGDVAALPGPLT